VPAELVVLRAAQMALVQVVDADLHLRRTRLRRLEPESSKQLTTELLVAEPLAHHQT